MSGLKGQIREPRVDPRGRRNSQGLASQVDFIGAGSVITLDGDGVVQLTLKSAGGLENDSDELTIKLDTDSGLLLAAGGLSLDAATTSVRGGVLQAAARADSGQDTVSLTGVTTAVTDPADAPVDADALRDDLVANALSEISTALGNLSTRDGELESAVETLAGEFNDLLAKLRTAGVLNT